MRLLLAEDERDMSAALVAILTHSGYDVDPVYDGEAAVEMAAHNTYDCMIFDIMMPKLDGVQALQQIRESGDVTPVIMLTAKGTEYDVVMGLDSGADDYIPKPFRMMELISRIKARLRRAEDKGAEEYHLENLYLCPGRHIVTVDQEPVNLTLKEYEMLVLLLKNSGMVLSRTQLLNQIWGYEFDGESRTVDVHIRTLRQKLGSAGDLIETVRGVGYKIGR